MRPYIFILLLATTVLSCVQNDTKQKELELRERELALKEKELENKEKTLITSNPPSSPNDSVANDKTISVNKKAEIKCVGNYQFSGKLVKVDFEEPPCIYAYLNIVTDDGKKMQLYIDENLDNFKIGNNKLFNWSSDKMIAKVDNMEKLPAGVIEQSLLNKNYVFCCFKQQLNCGDDPKAPKIDFCKKILEK